MRNHQRLHATDILNGRPHVLQKRRETAPHSTSVTAERTFENVTRS
jgi:hypothetical protein